MKNANLANDHILFQHISEECVRFDLDLDQQWQERFFIQTELLTKARCERSPATI